MLIHGQEFIREQYEDSDESYYQCKKCGFYFDYLEFAEKHALRHMEDEQDEKV